MVRGLERSASPGDPPQVEDRHDGCCGMPGCFRSAWKQVHHCDLRSEGGQHDPEGMVPLCFPHHEAVHRGALHITGRCSTGFGFFHADGRPHDALKAAPAPICAREDVVAYLPAYRLAG